jgi:glycosyltransferase involved in cell wall biosynthesis
MTAEIAIDAHAIGSRAGGNETYYDFLLTWLPRIGANGQRYVFYHTDKLALVGRPATNERIKFKQIRPQNRFLRIPISFPIALWRDKPDLFHAQYILPPFRRYKTVVSIFDLAHEHFPEFFHPVEGLRARLLVPGSARKADHIVTLSEYSAEDIAKTYDINPEKISVTYLAADDDFFPRDKYSCRAHIKLKYGIGDPFILYVGRLQGRKNLVRLLEAYAQVQREGVAEKLVIAGKKDWMYEQIADRVSKLKLDSDVIFTGYVSREDLPIFYNAAEVFVFPSIFEGFGLPVIEAMACGTPVVTSFGSSLQEVAGDAALLVDPLSVESLENALRRLLGNVELKRTLGEKGLRRSKEFSFQKTAAQTASIYERVLGGC